MAENPTGPSPDSSASPAASDFADVSGFVASLQKEKELEADTAEATKETALSTKGILDIIQGNIGKSVEKIAQTGKISREDLIIKDNIAAKRFGNLVSKITEVSSGIKGIKMAASGFFEFSLNQLVTLGLALAGGFNIIKLGLDNEVRKLQSLLLSVSFSGRFLGLIQGGIVRLDNKLKDAVGAFKNLSQFPKLAATVEVIRRFAIGTLGKFGVPLRRGVKIVDALGKGVKAITSIFRFVSGFLRIGFAFLRPILSIVSTISSVLGKLFFPITLAVSLVQGILNFFKKDGEGGIKGLLDSLFDALLKNLTFGFIGLQDFIGAIDTTLIRLRQAISFLTGEDDTTLELGLQSRRRDRERIRLTDELILERGFDPADVGRVVDQVLPRLLSSEEVSQITAATPGENPDEVRERLQAIEQRQRAAIDALVASNQISSDTASKMLAAINQLGLNSAADKAGGSTPPASPPPRDDKVVPVVNPLLMPK